MMQYYIEVVPTDIENFISETKTFQYSVKENARIIDHDTGSHGIPGLYFKYDMSALKVIVRVDRDNIIQFIVRLCSIIAGIVVLTSLVNSMIQLCFRGLVKSVAPQLVQHVQDAERHRINPIPSNILKSPSPPPANLLIDVSNAGIDTSPYVQ